MNKDYQQIADYIRQRSQSPEYREFMINLLTEMVDVRNTVDQPLAEITAQELKVFKVLEKSLKSFIGSDVTLEYAPIDPAIADHPYYTNPYYTADANHPNGLPVRQAYKDRCNLFAMVKPKKSTDKGNPVLLNAHVDTVAPFYPSRVDETYVHGRGACDDKGPVVTLAASMKLLAEVEEKFGPIASQPRCYQFVIEEEPGGNGSLSAALDKRFKNYQAIISEASLCVPYPANRGAMWFKMEIDLPSGCNTAQAIPFIFVEFAKEGQKLREETNLPLFPKNYIQVNLGSLNSFGRHPSAVQDYIPWEISVKSSSQTIEKIISLLHEKINSGLDQYTKVYEDRTKQIDPETKVVKLEGHYRLTPTEQIDGGYRFKLEIFGIGGHMSAMLLCDNALIKAGYVMDSVISGLSKISDIQAEYALSEKTFNPAQLLVTGGVGFTAAHPMAQLQKRMRDAAARGLERYNQLAKKNALAQGIRMTFDMLHNEAYASDVNCPAMKAIESAYKTMNLPWPKPLAWRASCDARIYGNNGYDTVVLGPGNLIDAHSDHEKIAISELHKCLEMITLATLDLITGRYE
jgi:acetylornithine deacetylase/succinyl-diaminopimelate desuccinylase-like protein